jgi:hypothetical protein
MNPPPYPLQAEESSDIEAELSADRPVFGFRDAMLLLLLLYSPQTSQDVINY